MPQSARNLTLNKWKNKLARHEVIRVASPAFLVTAKHAACRYETSDGKPLAPGYYLALWPSGGDYASYGREVRYLGPFVTQAEALLLRTSALALDIVETTKPAQATVPHVRGHGRFSASAGACSAVSKTFRIPLPSQGVHA